MSATSLLPRTATMAAATLEEYNRISWHNYNGAYIQICINMNFLDENIRNNDIVEMIQIINNSYFLKKISYIVEKVFRNIFILELVNHLITWNIHEWNTSVSFSYVSIATKPLTLPFLEWHKAADCGNYGSIDRRIASCNETGTYNQTRNIRAAIEKRCRHTHTWNWDTHTNCSPPWLIARTVAARNRCLHTPFSVARRVLPLLWVKLWSAVHITPLNWRERQKALVSYSVFKDISNRSQ